MAEFLRYTGLAVGAAVIALTLRGAHKTFGLAFSLLAGAALLLALMERLQGAVQTIGGIADYAGMSSDRTVLILKMLGVSFAAEFAAQSCRDAGEEGIAMRVELGGKVMLLVLSAPLFEQLARLILELTP